MLKTLLVLAAILLAGCEKPESFEQKIERMEFMRRKAHADVIRQKAECVAVAIEFNNDDAMNEDCRKSLVFTIEVAQRDIADADRGIERLTNTYCSSVLEKSKGGRFGGIPVSCDGWIFKN